MDMQQVLTDDQMRGLEPQRRPSTPRIVVPNAPPPRTPTQQRIDQGNAAAAPYEAPRIIATTRNTEQNTEQNNTLGHNFTDERAMRSQFEGLPDVRNYHTVLPVAVAARQAAQGGAGDLDLVYAFARVMDPGSVVREGEVTMTQNTGGIGDRVNGMVQSLSNGGHLTPQVRQRLVAEIDNRVNQYRAAYQQIRKNYYRNAERYGFDTDAAVGPDIGDAYGPGDNAPQGNLGTNVANGILGSLGAPQIGVGSSVPPPMPAVNAPGGVTATDSRESAQASQTAGRATEDNSGAAANPQMETESLNTYRDEWTNAVNSGMDRSQLDQWVRENAPRFFPGNQTPGQVDDDMWRAIEESRRTGRGLNWQAPSLSTSALPENLQGTVQQDYQDRAANAQGAQDRAAFAESNPILSRVDTVVRQGANALTLGMSDRIAGTLSGRGAAYEHGVTGEDWRSRPLESLGGTFAGGARLPYGSTLPRQMGIGAAYSGATSFNESDGPLSNRLADAYRGGATGLGVNTLVGGLGRAFRAPNADAILEAGARQDIQIPRYMLGRETAQVATGAVGATPGRIPLASAARRTIEGIETARNRAAAEIGDVGDNFEAGRRAQSGARQWLDASEQRGAEHFDRIPISAQTQANLTNTRAVLADVTQGLESNPRLSALLEDPQLNRFRDALTQGGLSWGDMKQFRTLVGRMIGRAQVASEGTHVQDLRALYSGLTQDMEATAAAQGPRALSMFRRANQYWRGREARREGVVTDILGRNMDAAPEDTFRMINRWAQRDTGNTTALAQTMRSLPRDDANAVRATLFARMGRSTKGQQDETGEAFSPFVFATQWAGLEPRAKSLLVPNRAHRRNLDDIALLATTMRRSERFTNTSNTGLGTNLGLFTVGGMTNPAGAAGAFASTYALGRLLSSPAGSATFLRALRNPEAFSGLLQGNDQEATQ